MVSGQLAQTNPGSVGGSRLLPRFCGYLAAHGRSNIIFAASDCKERMLWSLQMRHAGVNNTATGFDAICQLFANRFA
jgi:hypothetical protein